MKYQKLCDDILAVVSKDNIQDVFCCITRLRLIVKDKSAVDVGKLEGIKGIIQVKETGNQLQLVIGTHVRDVYEDFCSITGFTEKASIGDDETPKNQGSIASRVLDVISSIILPILPAFITGGMIKSLVLILTTFNMAPSTSGAVAVLNAIGDAPFYFLPFLVGMTTAKRFRLNQAFGVMIAGCLMAPTFINQTMGEDIRFLFFSIPSFSYASSMLPTALSVIAFSYLFRLVDKHIPTNFRIIFSGFISFTLFMPILLAVVAPLGNYCGEAMSSGIVALFDAAGPLAGALVSGLMPLMVMAGMHTALFPFMLQNITDLGFDPLIVTGLVSNFAVAGAVLGAAFKLKNAHARSEAIPGGILGILGVTEPALYGVAVKYHKPLMSSIIGGAIGGALYMLLGVRSYVFAAPNIFMLAGFIDKSNNLLFCVIVLIVTFIASFAVSYFWMRGNEDEA